MFVSKQFTKLARDLKVPGGGTKKQEADGAAEAGGDVSALVDDVGDLDLR